MSDGIVEVDFRDEPSAWLARGVLAANGIPSQVIAIPFDAGVPWGVRARPALRAQDLNAARKLLASGCGGPSA